MQVEFPIIIGSGLAGYNVAREFRKLNTTAELLIIADDAADFYSKPMLSNALVKNKMAHELPMANAEKMASDLNAKILKHTRISKIDPENCVVFTSDNKTMPVLVKTPTCSVVVAPPANGIEGEWIIKKDKAGVNAQYFDKDGKLQGFALVGEAIVDKQKLTKELPAVLA